MGRKKKPVNWKKYPVRRCYSIQYCDLCGGVIVIGDEYYDGGNGRRAHVDCVENRDVLYSKQEDEHDEQVTEMTEKEVFKDFLRFFFERSDGLVIDWSYTPDDKDLEDVVYEYLKHRIK